MSPRIATANVISNSVKPRLAPIRCSGYWMPLAIDIKFDLPGLVDPASRPSRVQSHKINSIELSSVRLFQFGRSAFLDQLNNAVTRVDLQFLRRVGKPGRRLNLRHSIGKNLPHTIFFLARSEEHTSELQSPCNLVCRLL